MKMGALQMSDLKALLEFVRRHPSLRPLVICDDRGRPTADRAGIAKAGPSGVRRPCSQFRKVWMLIPKALANACWLKATNRRKATMSSPDSILPAMILRHRLARIPRLKSLSLSSRALFINLTSGMFGTAPNRADRYEPVLVRASSHANRRISMILGPGVGKSMAYPAQRPMTNVKVPACGGALSVPIDFRAG